MPVCRAPKCLADVVLRHMDSVVLPLEEGLKRNRTEKLSRTIRVNYGPKRPKQEQVGKNVKEIMICCSQTETSINERMYERIYEEREK